MNFTETVEYLYSRLPMFQNIGKDAYKKDLTNTLALLKVLGNPHKGIPWIHIAGTNGKGSTSSMLNSILMESGYRVGLYTSPHLKSFTERIRVNGIEMEEQFVVDFVGKMKKSIETIKPSFFEITVAMCFDYFKFKKVEIGVIEVGLGGRLDSTNVIEPILSIITSIGYDHMDLLGDTLEKIAFEKAGIIKPKVPVIVNHSIESAPLKVIQEVAEHNSSPFFITENLDSLNSKNLNDFLKSNISNSQLEVSDNTVDSNDSGNSSESDNSSVLIDSVDSNDSFSSVVLVDSNDSENSNDLIITENSIETLFSELELKGNYQKFNFVTVLYSIRELIRLDIKIDSISIIKGLQSVKKNSGLRGRWEIIQTYPTVICDTGHNEDGVKSNIEQLLQTTDASNLRIVWGMVKDKDRSKILKLLPKESQYYLIKPSVIRGYESELLAQEFSAQEFKKVHVFSNVREAFEKSLLESKPTDVIFIGGSTFTVADFLIQMDL